MDFKLKIAALLCQVINISKTSIVGVTYMDDFDFEERYRDVNECNPNYYYPLHLPAACAVMYEKLLRKGIARGLKHPVRIVTKRKKTDIHYYEDQGFPVGPLADFEEVDFKEPVISPYDKMLKYLRKDVDKDPASPTLGFVPNLGPAAIYQQPISKKSTDFIKKLAEEYIKSFNQKDEYDKFIWPPPKGNKKGNKNKKSSKNRVENGDFVALFKVKKPC